MDQHCSAWINIVQRGSTLFSVDPHQHCSAWINIVQRGSTLFSVDQHCSAWINIVQRGSTLCSVDPHQYCSAWIHINIVIVIITMINMSNIMTTFILKQCNEHVSHMKQCNGVFALARQTSSWRPMSTFKLHEFNVCCCVTLHLAGWFNNGGVSRHGATL